MADNAIVLGAGASFKAGVPLLDTFVEKMRNYALKKTDDNKNPLTETDLRIFDEARKVMAALNEYHARAAFNDRNLEDLLSILSFSLLGQDEGEKSKLGAIIDAIVRTIELSCSVKHNGRLDTAQQEGDGVYLKFWDNIFAEWEKNKTVPVMISLNYDLVLERSLFQSLVTRNRFPMTFPFDGIILDYKYKKLPRFCYQLFTATYMDENLTKGTALRPCKEEELKRPITIEILKLHGSLNFPMNGMHETSLAPTNAVENPVIVPPISNKLVHDEMKSVWNSARNHLREVKNLIIIGYSLPRSDVYMQFFLKSALGPNRDFYKLIVFNPVFFNETVGSREMQQRYSDCFSEQLRDYIIYKPLYGDNWINTVKGSFEHFVRLLEYDGHGLFF